MYKNYLLNQGLRLIVKKLLFKTKKDMHIIKKPTRGIIKLKSNNSDLLNRWKKTNKSLRNT